MRDYWTEIKQLEDLRAARECEDNYLPLHQAIETAKREWTDLLAQYADNRDSEIEHENRDGILLRFMFKLAPDLAKAMKDREEEVRYWYA